MPLITVRSITKDYALGKLSVRALKGVDLDIEPGEFLAISGPSGSGKTTLLNIIGCIEKPTSGEVMIDGIDVKGQNDNTLSDIRLKKIGFVFQQFNLIPVLTAYENVEYPLLERGMAKPERKAKVDKMLADVGLVQHGHHRPLELSGGQRQRVAIARAMAGDPRIILADEPTANLDKATGIEIIDLMRSLNKNSGTTFVFSTHDPKVIEAATRVVKLSDGLVC